MIFFIGLGSFRTRVGKARILITASELRVLQHVDDLDVILALEVLLADSLEVGERRNATRGLTGDVEAQFPVGRRSSASLLAS